MYEKLFNQLGRFFFQYIFATSFYCEMKLGFFMIYEINLGLK